MAKPVSGKSERSDWFLLGRDFAVRTVSMETVQDVYFCFGAKLPNSKFATTTAKLPEKGTTIEILLRFQRWMKKTNIRRASWVLSWTSGNFWFRNWNGHYRKPGGHRRFNQPTETCKRKQRNDYWYERSSPLHYSKWYEKWENWKLTCVRAWTLVVEICLNARRKNGEEYEPATVSSFQPSLSLKQYSEEISI